MIQADLRDMAGWVPDSSKKSNIAIETHEFFGFTVPMKVVLKIYCSQ